MFRLPLPFGRSSRTQAKACATQSAGRGPAPHQRYQTGPGASKWDRL